MSLDSALGTFYGGKCSEGDNAQDLGPATAQGHPHGKGSSPAATPGKINCCRQRGSRRQFPATRTKARSLPGLPIGCGAPTPPRRSPRSKVRLRSLPPSTLARPSVWASMQSKKPAASKPGNRSARQSMNTSVRFPPAAPPVCACVTTTAVPLGWSSTAAGPLEPRRDPKMRAERWIRTSDRALKACDGLATAGRPIRLVATLLR